MSLCSGLTSRYLTVIFLVVAVQAQSPEMQQSLQSRYQDKIFLLRGFFPGDELRFDAAGTPIGNPLLVIGRQTDLFSLQRREFSIGPWLSRADEC